MKKIFLLTLAIAVFSLNAFSQTLTAVESDEDKTTKIIFTCMLAGQEAEIFTVNSVSYSSSSTLYVGSSGKLGVADNSSYGTNTTFLCKTPAEFILDKGDLQLQAGTASLARPFTISATGGTQEWSIRGSRPELFSNGVLLMGLGMIAAGIGIPFGILFENSGYYALSAGGVAVSVCGIVMMSKASAKATLVRVTY